MRLAWILALALCLPAAADPILPSEGSLYADVRASQVGDTVTVLVRDVTTVAQQYDGRSDRDSRVNIPYLGSLLTGFFLPPMTMGGNSGGRARASTTQRFESSLAVRVVEALPNGDLVVEGGRRMVINGEEQSLALRGVVRAADLGPDNTVESNRLADVSIDYKGPLEGKARAGLITTIFEILF